jgi:hypothetical protein
MLLHCTPITAVERHRVYRRKNSDEERRNEHRAHGNKKYVPKAV